MNQSETDIALMQREKKMNDMTLKWLLRILNWSKLTVQLKKTILNTLTE